MTRKNTFQVMAVALSAALTMTAAAEPVIPGYEGKVRELIESAAKQYRSATSYSDVLLVREEMEPAGLFPVIVGEEELRIAFAFSRPGKVAFEAAPYQVFADGQHIWQYPVQLQQYIQTEAPAQLSLDDLSPPQVPIFEQLRHPAMLAILEEGDDVELLLGPVASFGEAQEQKLEDRPAWRIRGQMQADPSAGPGAQIPFEVWFDSQTTLLAAIRYDHTKPLQESLARVPEKDDRVEIRQYVQHLRFTEVKLNGELPAERFTFKPGQQDEKVTAFRMVPPEDWQQKLKGQPAPPFMGIDFEGKPVKLADHKGRVVLLDFWSTTCPPCIAAMPTIQKLASDYADKPVTILGVNADPPGGRKRVKDVLARSKATYGQVRDFTGTIARAYRISGIPCMVVIDKQGVVQAIRVGFAPGEEEELAKQIDALLK